MTDRRFSGADGDDNALWRIGLAWLREVNTDGTHPLDKKRARNLARGMRMLGERPDASEVNAEIGRLWGRHRPAAKMTVESWRSVYRVKTSIGRTYREDAPLYHPDRLIEVHRLTPSTEERLERVLIGAVRKMCEAASQEGTDHYLQAKRELDDAITAIEHLRYLRFGPQSLGIRGFGPETPRRPPIKQP